jgi:arsenate reductase-like glutaredoxin family protein
MKDSPPSRREALELMARHPNLIRRPILVGDGRVIAGFDAAAYDEAAD